MLGTLVFPQELKRIATKLDENGGQSISATGELNGSYLNITSIFVVVFIITPIMTQYYMHFIRVFLTPIFIRIDGNIYAKNRLIPFKCRRKTTLIFNGCRIALASRTLVFKYKLRNYYYALIFKNSRLEL